MTKPSLTKLAGIFAALPTPFDWAGDVYPIKVTHNVARWNRVAALAGYVVAGRAGEANELSRDEKEKLFALVKEAAIEGRVLVAGVGAESLRNSIALSQRAGELGYQAVLADPQGREATLAYYRALADQAKLPVIVAGAADEVAIAASQHPNVAAVIVEGGVAAVSKGVRQGVQVLVGRADALAQSLQDGAAGAVLAYSAAAPYSTITIWEAVRTREMDAALDWQRRIAKAVECVESKYGVAGLKHAMDVNGYYGGPPRLPLAPITAAGKAEIEKALETLKG